MSQATTDRTTEYSTNPVDLPSPFRWGLGIGLVGFIVRMTSTSSRSVNGVVTECSFVDFAALLTAAACVLFAGVGAYEWRRQRREHWTRTRPSPHGGLALGAVLVLVLLAAVHLVRGLGMVGGPC